MRLKLITIAASILVTGADSASGDEERIATLEGEISGLSDGAAAQPNCV